MVSFSGTALGVEGGTRALFSFDIVLAEELCGVDVDGTRLSGVEPAVAVGFADVDLPRTDGLGAGVGVAIEALGLGGGGPIEPRLIALGVPLIEVFSLVLFDSVDDLIGVSEPVLAFDIAEAGLDGPGVAKREDSLRWWPTLEAGAGVLPAVPFVPCFLLI
jgi:hypothetical protein